MLRRIDVLQQIFLGHVPATVQPDLRDIRELGLGSEALVQRLEALRERHRLSPPEDDDGATPLRAEVVRIVSSDGLVG